MPKTVLVKSEFEVVSEFCGYVHDTRENVDKIWAACYMTNGQFLSVWGRRNTRYNITPKKFPSEQGARAWYEKKKAEKKKKQYQSLPFSQQESAVHAIVQLDDGGYRFTGGIPSFHLSNNPYVIALRDVHGVKGSEISGPALLSSCHAMLDSVTKWRRMSPEDLPRFLSDYQTLQIRYSVWIEFANADEIFPVKTEVDKLTGEVELMLTRIAF